MPTFHNALTGEDVEATDWQLAIKPGDHYVIESPGLTVYGQVTEPAEAAGFFWAKGFSVHCTYGETGLVCICDMSRRIEADEFEAARANGWLTAGDERHAILNKYLQTHAPPLGARAWLGYQQAGRGVLVVVDNQVVGYVQASDFIMKLSEHLGSEHPLFKEVRTYNPEISFVIYYSLAGWPAAIGQRVLPIVPPPAAASPSTYTTVAKANKRKKQQKGGRRK